MHPIVVLSCDLMPLTASSAFGFGREGHETTGAIAAELLSGTHAEKEIAKSWRARVIESPRSWANDGRGSRGGWCANSKLHANKEPMEAEEKTSELIQDPALDRKWSADCGDEPNHPQHAMLRRELSSCHVIRTAIAGQEFRITVTVPRWTAG